MIRPRPPADKVGCAAAGTVAAAPGVRSKRADVPTAAPAAGKVRRRRYGRRYRRRAKLCALPPDDLHPSAIARCPTCKLPCDRTDRDLASQPRR